jgi:hypothetical protein
LPPSTVLPWAAVSKSRWPATFALPNEQAKLALPEARVGLLPCAGGTQRLAQLVGEGWAKRMILCNERIDAATAERIGLVEEVVQPGTARARALDLAEQAAQQSPSAVARCKRLIHSARDKAIVDGLAAERELFVELFSTEDQREGVNAFLEKREPEWKNACLKQRRPTGPRVDRGCRRRRARPPDPEQPEDSQFPDPGDGRSAAGALDAWRDDPEVAAIVIDGAGKRPSAPAATCRPCTPRRWARPAGPASTRRPSSPASTA